MRRHRYMHQYADISPSDLVENILRPHSLSKSMNRSTKDRKDDRTFPKIRDDNRRLSSATFPSSESKSSPGSKLSQMNPLTVPSIGMDRGSGLLPHENYTFQDMLTGETFGGLINVIVFVFVTYGLNMYWIFSFITNFQNDPQEDRFPFF